LFAHLPKFREAGLSVVALHSRDEQKGKNLASEHGITHSFSSIDEMMQCDDIDIVAISLPTRLRKEAVIAASRHGRHVLTQPTPPGLSVADVQEMLASAQTSGIHHFLDLELRWVPGLQRIRSLLQDTAVPSNLHVRQIRFTTTLGLGYLQKQIKKPEDVVWKHDAAQGGGVWAAFGLHFVDLAQFILNDQVRHVRAEASDLLDVEERNVLDVMGIQRPADAKMFVELKTSYGVFVTINLNARPNNKANENRMIVECLDGKVIEFDFLTSSMTVFDQSRVVESISGTGTAFTQVGEPRLAAAIESSLRLETSSQDDLATLHDGVLLQLVHEAVHKSLEQSGTWQEVRQIQNEL